MPLLAYFLLQLLFITPPLSAPIWGLQGGESRDELLEQFSPIGQDTNARWTSQVSDSIEVLRYECNAKNRCFTHQVGLNFSSTRGDLLHAPFS